MLRHLAEFFPRASGGEKFKEWSYHWHTESGVLIFSAITVSQYASSQTPTDLKASLPSQCHLTTPLGTTYTLSHNAIPNLYHLSYASAHHVEPACRMAVLQPPGLSTTSLLVLGLVSGEFQANSISPSPVGCKQSRSSSVMLSSFTS